MSVVESGGLPTFLPAPGLERERAAGSGVVAGGDGAVRGVQRWQVPWVGRGAGDSLSGQWGVWRAVGGCEVASI